MPQILVSNDDGIHAPGILALIEIAQEWGEVTVVAPDSPQSGMGHAISIGVPLRIKQESLPGGLTGHACSGTPADCVKLATGVLMDQTPDLIVSGINHGSNSSVSSIYSGTLSAAREGALQGIPSIGFSLCNFRHHADMTASQEVARVLIREALERPLPKGEILNVNIPDLPLDKLKGIRITRQARGRWVEEFEERMDPYGRKYYWLTGKFKLMDTGLDTDEHALAEGYVSATPMTTDFTDHRSVIDFQTWNIHLRAPHT